MHSIGIAVLGRELFRYSSWIDCCVPGSAGGRIPAPPSTDCVTLGTPRSLALSREVQPGRKSAGSVRARRNMPVYRPWTPLPNLRSGLAAVGAEIWLQMLRLSNRQAVNNSPSACI